MFTETQIQQYFEEIEAHIMQPEKRCSMITVRHQLVRQDGAGVYCAFDKGELCYVGESGNLYERFNDINRTLNHTFRRNLGRRLYEEHELYTVASSSKKFHDDIEILLNEYVSTNIQVSYKCIRIGRKEFEEWMQARYPLIKWLNKEKKRKAYS